MIRPFLPVLLALLAGCAVNIERPERTDRACQVTACDDCNPCTLDQPYGPLGCTHNTLPDGSDCLVVDAREYERLGACCAAACVPPEDDGSAPLCR